MIMCGVAKGTRGQEVRGGSAAENNVLNLGGLPRRRGPATVDEVQEDGTMKWNVWVWSEGGVEIRGVNEAGLENVIIREGSRNTRRSPDGVRWTSAFQRKKKGSGVALVLHHAWRAIENKAEPAHNPH